MTAPPPDTTEPGNTETSTVVKDNNTSKSGLNEASAPNGVAVEDSMPPNLEEFIPRERLPDVINVYIDEKIFVELRDRKYLKQFTEIYPGLRVRYKRLYPDPPLTLGNDHDCSKTILTGELDLRRSQFLGIGNHSKTVLAPLMIPSTPSVYGAVAVKTGINGSLSAYRMLLNEGKIYTAFPRHLQDPAHRDDVPIVPKFYGLYGLSFQCSHSYGNDLDKKEHERDFNDFLRRVLAEISPILLLEACGKAVRGYYPLSNTDRKVIGTLLRRLHEAKFTQGSMHRDNVVVQPGPLNVPRANRSLDTPSFRIIDFGRGLDFGATDRNMDDEAEEDRSFARDNNLIR